MFFFKNKPKPAAMSDDDQAILQRRLYLAENTPEPVFDLANCKLTEVPAGVLAKCRVFRKTSLLLQNNSLTTLPDLKDLTLLTTLNLSCNQLREIPESIGRLVNLAVLDLRDNQIQRLPGSMSKMKSLRTLDVSFNKLKYLPQGLRSLGCTVISEGCPLLPQVDLPSKKSEEEADEGGQGEDEDDDQMNSVLDKRERMLSKMKEEMAALEARLFELTVHEYEKRDKKQEDQMVAMAEERVELAANLNDLLIKRDIQISEFRAAGLHFEFEESGIVDRDCVVCLEDGIQLVVLLPCGHVCVCRTCSEKLTHCPLCREPINRQ